MGFTVPAGATLTQDHPEIPCVLKYFPFTVVTSIGHQLDYAMQRFFFIKTAIFLALCAWGELGQMDTFLQVNLNFKIQEL